MVRRAASADSGDRVEIGVVARAHGVRGEVRIHLHNPESRALDDVTSIFVGERATAVESSRAVVGGAYLVHLEGVADRDQAQALRGQPVAVERGDIDLDDEDVLLVDLVGCRVELTDGTEWGVIAAVEPGAQDRLVIHHGDVERQLPVADQFLIDIDLEARRVV
ncbi:MAG TPA: ribosome maturation factor RimM, partial [Kofleriaceae bacterium]|nr:ribosome maturation factor RimM [Kofleriaceae bacterium]